MASFWQRLTGRAEDAPAQIPTVRDNIFSTGGGEQSRSRRVALYRRQVDALSRTFQRGVEALVPYDAAGNAMPAGGDYAMDEAYPDLSTAKLVNSSAGYLPITQLEWYSTQGFIGWQICAVLSQNWLIDKACTIPGQDAVRNGWSITANDGSELPAEIMNAMATMDKRTGIKAQAREFVKLGRTFGIRHALFLVDGIDYEAPFNPDGVRPGSYKGITQIDPYWISPMLDRSAAADPAAPDFYEPTWWLVNGKRVHRSHFIIMRNGDAVPDILKPSYIYGGIPIPQKIFERVYAAERCANEAPMVLMTKRMTVLKTDTTKWFGPEAKAQTMLQDWMELQTNFSVKVVGSQDEVQQFETSLSGMDETIMTQYQLVAAACGVPATKLLGTSPKGFNATGEYEEANYHEELESIQENILTPLIERHHQLMMRSYIAPKFGIAPVRTEIKWNKTDSYTAKEEAEINEIKSRTANNYVTAGAIDGTDLRKNIIADPTSGFNGIEEIVPGGPGDRAAQQEADAALEAPVTAKPKAMGKDDEAQDSAEPMRFDPARGTLDGARIITHQKYLDDGIVRAKMDACDFEVFVTPAFDIDGKQYRMVMDGHHSLAAAQRAKICPVFTVRIPKPEIFNAITREVMDEMHKEAARA